MSSQLVIDMKNAFAFVQQLYVEVALLIQELESQMHREDERFRLATPSGYNVVARGSSAIDNVRFWPTRKFSIFFVPEAKTEVKGGQTITPISESVLYLRFLLDEYAT